MSTVFPLPPPPLRIVLFLALGLTLPIGILLFRVVKHGFKNKNIISEIIALSFIMGIFGFFTACSYQINVEISQDELIVRCPPFGTKVVGKVNVIKAFVVDWNTNSSYRPVLRTGGTSLGSYKTGWFKLENGSPALLVSSSSKKLCIPTTEGYYLLLSPQGFTKFLETFKCTLASLS